MTKQLAFTKLVGTGNDFVLIDRFADQRRVASRWSQVAKKVCDRRDGIGADGLLILESSRIADIRMRIFNPDGSEPSMCGNGIRCLVWYASDLGVVRKQMSVETKAGVLSAEVKQEGMVRINIGTPRALRSFPNGAFGDWSPKGSWLIDSGVPHLVCPVASVDEINLEELGPALRFDSRLGKEGANVNFIEVGASGKQIRARTFERGVEGETFACGTGAVASAAAVAAQRGVSKRYVFSVNVLGGRLRVEVGVTMGVRDLPIFSEAILEGPARRVAKGVFEMNGRT